MNIGSDYKTYPVPAEKLGIVRDLASEIRDLAEQRKLLDQQYTQGVQALHDRADKLRTDSVKAMCETVGIAFDPSGNTVYVLETGYLEHGVSFLVTAQLIDTGETNSEVASVAAQAPPKSRLN